MLISKTFGTRKLAQGWLELRDEYIKVPDGHTFIDYNSLIVCSRYITIDRVVYGITRSYIRKGKKGFTLRLRLAPYGYLALTTKTKPTKWQLFKTTFSTTGRKER